MAQSRTVTCYFAAHDTFAHSGPSWRYFGASCLALCGAPLPRTRWCCQRPCVPSRFSISSIGSAMRRRPRGMCTFGSAIATELAWSHIWRGICGAVPSKTRASWPGMATASPSPTGTGRMPRGVDRGWDWPGTGRDIHPESVPRQGEIRFAPDGLLARSVPRAPARCSQARPEAAESLADPGAGVNRDSRSSGGTGTIVVGGGHLRMVHSRSRIPDSRGLAATSFSDLESGIRNLG